MNKYFDITKAYTLSEGERPPAHLTEFFNTVQGLVDRAYNDGFQAGVQATEECYKEAQIND